MLSSIFMIWNSWSKLKPVSVSAMSLINVKGTTKIIIIKTMLCIEN